MVIYQDDYTKVSLQSPVSLLISSVRRDILLAPTEFYHWMDQVMGSHGVVFIDMPSESRYVNALSCFNTLEIAMGYRTQCL